MEIDRKLAAKRPTHKRSAERERIGPVAFWIPVPNGIPSKKNNLRPGGKGRGFHYDSSDEQILGGMELVARGKWAGRPRLTDIEIQLHFGISSKRRDLDNASVTVMDVLVKAGVLRNDSPAHVRKNDGHSFDMVPKYSEGVNVTVSGVEARK